MTTSPRSVSLADFGTPVRIGNRWHFANGRSVPVVAGAAHDVKVSFPELDEIEGRIAAKAKEADAILAEAKNADGTFTMANVKSLGMKPLEVAEHFATLQAEMDDLTKEADKYRPAKKAAIAKAEREARGLDFDDDEPGDGTRKAGDISPRYKSLGEAMQAAGLLKSNVRGELEWDVKAHIDAVKALFSTTAGWAPEVTRSPRLVDLVYMPFMDLLRLIPTTRTQQNAVKYMRETLATNTAAETAEGAAKPEAALEVDEDDSLVRKIAVTLPVTDEQFDDEPRAREYVNNRLERFVLERLAGQIINGDGLGVNLLGILNDPGIQTQAAGANQVDAVYLAMVKVMTTGGAFPNAYVTNPLNWATIRLTKTTDGIYIWGNPAVPGPETIFGLRVVNLQQTPLGTGLVGDFTNAELAIRKDVGIDTGYVNNQFRENRKTVRAEMRAALMVYRAPAFCEVTGLTAPV